MKTIKAYISNGALLSFLISILAATTLAQQTSPSPLSPPTSPAASLSSSQGAAQVSANDGRVLLSETALSIEANAPVTLAATLRSTPTAGSPDAPTRGVRFIVTNRSQAFITFVAGRVSFYDAAGVRCGDGLFAVNAFAAGEQVETDAPGLHLTCAPTTWRIVITQLVLDAQEVTTVAPQASANMTLENAPVIVFVSRDNKIYVGGIETNKTELGTRLASLLSAKPAGESFVKIDADPEANYGLVMEVADAARNGGASRVQFGEGKD